MEPGETIELGSVVYYVDTSTRDLPIIQTTVTGIVYRQKTGKTFWDKRAYLLATGIRLPKSDLHLMLSRAVTQRQWICNGV
jgi:hypothetical protein